MNRINVHNNLWGNPDKEIINASDVTKKKSGIEQYKNVKNQANLKKNKHTYGIGYTDDDSSSAILTSRSYEDKYMISKAKFYACNDNDNIDYLKYHANNGNKLQVKYKKDNDYYIQILYTGNINSIDGKRHEYYDMIQDPSIDGEGYIVKINQENWINLIADLSYNQSNSYINQTKINPLNNKNFRINGPIELS